MSMAVISEGSGTAFTDVVGWLFLAFLILVLVALVVRVVIAIIRRKPRGIKDAFEPIVRSGRIQSELYGVKTFDTDDLAPKSECPPRDRS